MHVFSIEGRVTGPMGDDGVAGLIIDVADRDLIFYEALGQATTDEDGRFHKRYEAHGLEALFDARPKVSLVIRDARGAVVHRHEAADRCEAGRVVRVEVRLDEAQVAAHQPCEDYAITLRRALSIVVITPFFMLFTTPKVA